MQRPFHVTVWGASGFTGRLVCEHIARDYKGQVSWAMAGRNEAKLKQIREELAAQYGQELSDTPILIGSLDDAASLDKIASQTSVIISTAGPFALYGTPVVEAAVRQSCDGYVDITGEVPWVKRLIQSYHEEAAKRGVRVVPCCGYDSVPSDIGTHVLVTEMQRRFGQLPVEIVNAVVAGSGGVSGGSLATGMLLVREQAKIRASGGASGDGMYALIPEGATPGSDQDVWGAEYNRLLRSWAGPFVMQVCNNRIVHRSNYLLGWGGAALHYREATMVPSWLAAKAVAVGTAAVGGVVRSVWLHPLLRRFLPAQGSGPSREAMMVTGFWKNRLVGVSHQGARVEVAIGDAHRDAGYWGTSRMVLEAALCIALQKAALDSDPQLVRGGVLTPAAALGGVLVDRLRKAGLTVEVKDAQAAAAPVVA